jgi:MFS family permease
METRAYRRAAWIVLAMLLFFSVAAPLNQFKVPPVMPILMTAFQLSAERAGWLMSVFAVTGLALALPAGFIFQKLGFRITGLLAVGAVLAGAVAGALSANVGALLAARVVEGVGMSLTAVVAPAVIAMWFKAEERGTPMGIWATWVPLGSSIMLVVAPLLAGASSWPRVWWFGAAWAAAGAVLYFAFVRQAPPRADGTGAAPTTAATTADLRRVLRNRDLWLLALEFGCFNFGVIGFTTWTPTFLNTTRGLSLAQASFLVSLAMMLNIVSGPVSGVVSDAIGSRRWIIVIPLALMAPVWPLAHSLGGGAFVALMVGYGLVSGCVPTGTFAAATEAVGDERLGGMAMAVVQVGQNAGMLLGPLVVGTIVGATGSWSAAYWALVPVTALGVAAAWVARMR